MSVDARKNWQPPPTNYKLNVDGATDSPMRCYDFIRNHDGHIEKSLFAKQEECDISVLTTELFALKTELEFALVELNCLEAVLLVNKQEDS